MKKSIVVIGILLCVICSAGRCFAKVERPDLGGIDCEHWLSYEDDMADYMLASMGKAGLPLSKKDKHKEKMAVLDEQTNAANEKASYMLGLIDAFGLIGRQTTNDALILRFRVGQYATELDNYCEQPENKEARVVLALITVNQILKAK